jgi:TRAP-type mannitol/chloroaromatic compound transport system permease small subunit
VNGLLALSRAIDALSARVGRTVIWLVLAAVVISAGNAIVRKAFDYSSNAWLEVQWYLFSAVFLLAAAYTLLRNEHIRIDVVAGRFSKRTQTWIDVIGTVFFLLPMVALVLYESWPWFVRAWISE